MEAALQALTALPQVDNLRLAAIGYCFGGGVVLNMARWALPIRAAVSFHGNPTPLNDQAKQGTVHTAILLQHGGLDTMVTMDKVDAFRAEMDAAQARYDVVIFDDAKHGFTNPKATENGIKNGVDLAFHPTAAQKSWDNMLAFLANELR